MYEYYKMARLAAGLSDYAVCKMCGISPSVISEWKNGRSKAIGADKLQLIAKALNVSMEYLLTGAESPNEPLSASERELLRLFRSLSPEGRTEATERIKEMTESTRWKKKEPHKLSESGIA